MRTYPLPCSRMYGRCVYNAPFLLSLLFYLIKGMWVSFEMEYRNKQNLNRVMYNYNLFFYPFIYCLDLHWTSLVYETKKIKVKNVVLKMKQSIYFFKKNCQFSQIPIFEFLYHCNRYRLLIFQTYRVIT